MATLTPFQGASPLNANDATRLAFTNDLTQTLSRTAVPTDTDLGNMDTLSWQVDYRVSAVPTDDTYALSIRIVNGATILAAANSGGTFATVATNIILIVDTLSAVTAFAYVNTGASKATWGGASVELTQTYTRTKGNDAIHIEVDFTEFTGTYTVGAATFNGTGAASLAFTASGAGNYQAAVFNGTGSASLAFTASGLLGGAVVLLQAKNYSGSGNWLDESSNGHDATLVGSPTHSTDHFVLNGTSQYFTVADHDDLDFNAQSFTVMAVCYADALSGTFGQIVSKYVASTIGYELGAENTVAQVRAYDVVNNTDVNSSAAAATVQAWTGRYNHSTSELETFVDGVGSGSPTSVSVGDLRTSTVLSIGARNGGVALWAGRVYAVAIWRRALTGQEIIDAGDLLTPSGDFNGTGSASLALTASATGHGVYSGTASASLVLSASAAGFGVYTGTAAADVVLTASGTGNFGAASFNGTGSASLVLTASGQGHGEDSGTGSAGLVLSASGQAHGEDSTTGSADLVLSASGVGNFAPAGFNGQGSATLTLTSSGAGNYEPAVFNESATASLVLTASGQGDAGVPSYNGTGSANLAFTATGVGAFDPTWSSTGSAALTFTATGSGIFEVSGSGTGSLVLTATGTGSFVPAGFGGYHITSGAAVRSQIEDGGYPVTIEGGS